MLQWAIGSNDNQYRGYEDMNQQEAYNVIKNYITFDSGSTNQFTNLALRALNQLMETIGTLEAENAKLNKGIEKGVDGVAELMLEMAKAIKVMFEQKAKIGRLEAQVESLQESIYETHQGEDL